MSAKLENCSKCSKLSSLEISFDGKNKLCKPCLIDDFKTYKQYWSPACSQFDHKLEFYKSQIDSLNTLLNSNLEVITQIESQIIDAYNNQFRILEKEKNDLLSIIKDCKKDNTKFFDFKNELNTISQNFRNFQDPAQNLFENNVLNGLVKSFEKSYQSAQKIDENFSDLVTKPIRKIERFDRVPVKEDAKYIGFMNVSTQNVNVNNQTQSSLNSLVKAFDPFNQKSNKNLNNLEIWIKKTKEQPYQELLINTVPTFLTSYRNYLFCVDDKQILTVLSCDVTNDINGKNTYKIPIDNISSIAANLRYFAVSYANLDKKIIKSKKAKENGIALYKRDLDVVDFNTERFYNLNNDKSFILPIGIGLNEEFIFVCDKYLKEVFKISIESGEVKNKISIPNGEPYKLSLNRENLVVTDTLQHRLCLIDLNSFKMSNCLEIGSNTNKNGPFSIYITNDNLIFFKNSPTSQLILTDSSFENQYLFKNLGSDILGFCLLENTYQILVVGIMYKGKQPKLLCFANN